MGLTGAQDRVSGIEIPTGRRSSQESSVRPHLNLNSAEKLSFYTVGIKCIATRSVINFSALKVTERRKKETKCSILF